MKANELTEGKRYVAKVSNKLTIVRLDKIVDGSQFNARKRYHVTNLRTNRQTVFRSPTKFRREAQS